MSNSTAKLSTNQISPTPSAKIVSRITRTPSSTSTSINCNGTRRVPSINCGWCRLPKVSRIQNRLTSNAPRGSIWQKNWCRMTYKWLELMWCRGELTTIRFSPPWDNFWPNYNKTLPLTKLVKIFIMCWLHFWLGILLLGIARGWTF